MLVVVLSPGMFWVKSQEKNFSRVFICLEVVLLAKVGGTGENQLVNLSQWLLLPLNNFKNPQNYSQILGLVWGFW